MDMDDSDQEELDWDKDADSQDELSETNSKLGFRPQKRLPATFHLPYDVDLDREAADNLAKIKLNLAAALTANDLLGWQLYTQRLNKSVMGHRISVSYLLTLKILHNVCNEPRIRHSSGGLYPLSIWVIGSQQ